MAFRKTALFLSDISSSPLWVSFGLGTYFEIMENSEAWFIWNWNTLLISSRTCNIKKGIANFSDPNKLRA